MLNKKLSLFVLSAATAASMQAQSLLSGSLNDSFFQDPFGDDMFKEIAQIQQQVDKMFSHMQQRIDPYASSMANPSMGMYQLSAQNHFVDKGDHYEMVTNIPKSKENYIDIRTQNGMMTISAKIVHEEKQQANGIARTSKSIQSFQQNIPLASDADEGKIESKFSNGRLVIIVPKKQDTKAITPTPLRKLATTATPKKAVETGKTLSPQKAEQKK
ncbi:MAG: Hsp20/alpha crystallin family protein [Sulfurovum sp.]|nr:Hsp20/alpha crystallin family protein [Sulfurovum sp.]MCB4746784.1 Hsp20/alpha crystallin family protein [Sulfurovum sp.]MCB4749505.1 Hsp20/alpha crystallin family protein [Sulfurovum sp.]MCB4750233.1 Hsp20/alpha crystallin family protein [Sulfurovum sp.]MCB4752476.1 Hsp20/alpha crystallin family protein [Sulfurovum sp.]